MTFSVFIVLLLTLFSFDLGEKDEATKSRILELAALNLEQHLDMNTYRFELEAKWIPGSLLESSPDRIISVKIEGNIEEYTRFTVIHRTQSGREANVIQLKIDAEQLVPVALTRLTSNTDLNVSDFDLRWTPVRIGKDRFVEDLVSLQGKSIRRSLQPGEPVRQHEISDPIIISAGDNIYMNYTAGTISLSLNCESRQSGALGDEIQIYCIETRKKYTAKIISSGEVQWLRTN